MAIFEINTQPADRQLMQFGLICVVAIPVAVWMWGGQSSALIVGGIAGVALGLVGLISPGSLKPVFVGLVFLTFPLGLIVGELIMLTIYFGLFLPMALMFRMIGRDALQRRTSTDAVSFWSARTSPTSVRKYYQQS